MKYIVLYLIIILIKMCVTYGNQEIFTQICNNNKYSFDKSTCLELAKISYDFKNLTIPKIEKIFINSNNSNCCPSTCGKILSKCSEICTCDLPDCKCCPECMHCLGSLYKECCDCIFPIYKCQEKSK